MGFGDDSDISWTICKQLLQTDNPTTPFLQAGCSFNSVKALKASLDLNSV